MNLENSIKDCITKEIEKGIIEKVIAQKMEECVASAVKDIFSWGGEVKKVIEQKIKSVMIPYLESYNYSEYIVKLDTVLVDVLKSTALENKNILENFKELMSSDLNIKSIKVSEIFKKWCDHVAKNVDTNDLDIDYDDGVSYYPVEVTYEFEEDYSDRSWLKKETGKIMFECEHDKEMNVFIEAYRYTDIHEKNEWTLRYDSKCDLSSLRNLDKFSLFLMSLSQCGVKIEIDITGDRNDVTPDKEPEASFS